MNFTRKLVVAAVAGILSLGVVTTVAPAANADTSWACPGCKRLR
jgi:hypothetical protein